MCTALSIVPLRPHAAFAQEAAAQADDDDGTFFDKMFAWFDPSRKKDGQPPVADAVRYKVTINVTGEKKAVESTITDASNLESLKKSPPSGAAGLLRRAIADQERIVAALYAEGFYAGAVSIHVAGRPLDSMDVLEAIEAARPAGPVPVKVDVETGPQFNFGTINVLDARTHQPLAIRPTLKQMRLVPGEVAKATAVGAAERTIVDTLRDHGYPFANVANKDVVADHARKLLDVTFYVDAGQQAKFGSFKVSGTKDLDPNFIRDRIGIAPGEPYSAERLVKLRKKLAEYEALGGVRVREGDKLDANGELPITIEVTEREPRYVGFGAKYSTGEGSTLSAYWGHRNLFGGAETLRLDASVSWYGEKSDAVPDADPFGYRVAATFAKPGIITAQDDLVMQAAALREVTNAYVRDAVTFLGGIRHHYSDELSVQVGLDLEQSQVEDKTGTRDDTIVGVPIDVAYDTTDNPLDATRGIRAAATVEPFAYLGQAGAGPVMLKGSISAYHALDDDKRYILAGKVAAGSLMGTDFENVPPQRRFYVGGGGSLRGFDYQMAGPKDADGDPIGGLSFFTASAEMRIKVTDTIGIVPFMDMGSAFASEVPDFSGLKFSAGLGLRYYTSIGPLRLDFAVPLNPDEGDSKYGVYVSVGQSF